MKILLVSEGASELAGALKTLVQRLGLNESEIEQKRVSDSKLHAHHGKGKGYFKRSLRWMLQAQKEGYDALILVIDHDDRAERKNELDEAQAYQATTIPRALGVAIKTFDAWMLADEVALTAILNRNIQRQPSAEELADPKSLIQQIAEEANWSDEIAVLYTQISERVDLTVLRQRCERGFGVFAQRVEGLCEQGLA